ncbi:unnamed protein product [Mycena citricolor]|uniref:Uncharacterized protein n=1 Tax=Mycena citricolor TaxID=2018698 RepID=A0AAD2K6I4_9AGAR|nr:unnamed protein product [Mycena citricolor]
MLCLFFVLSLVAGVLTSYSLSDSYAGDEFYQWTWESFSDPTHGRVDYVDQSTAIALNLTVGDVQRVVFDASRQHPYGPSRRARSEKRAHNIAQGLRRFGARPRSASHAGWLRNLAGVVDVVEGWPVAARRRNRYHRGREPGQQQSRFVAYTENCTMPMDKYQRGQTGDTASTNCDASFNYNQGCGVAFSEPNSYSTDFNDNGGGWYVLHRSAASGISIWFWSRGNPDVPDEVAQGLDTLNPDFWGSPERPSRLQTAVIICHISMHISWSSTSHFAATGLDLCLARLDARRT